MLISTETILPSLAATVRRAGKKNFVVMLSLCSGALPAIAPPLPLLRSFLPSCLNLSREGLRRSGGFQPALVARPDRGVIGGCVDRLVEGG